MAKWLRSSDGKRKRYVAVETTRKGRVVYNRKPHLFSLADAKRVTSRILFDGDNPVPNFLELWTDLMVHNFSLLFKAYALPLAIDAAVAIVQFTISLVLNFPQLIFGLGDMFNGSKDTEG